LDDNDQEGDIRLAEPNNYVRREILYGLSARKRIVPVLIDGAPLLSRAKLPSELAALAD
jgi:hypothetical protein